MELRDIKERLGQVDMFLCEELRRARIPGIAVAIIHGGEVLKAQGYGLANVELDVPVTERTVFQSASVGKQFTAAAILLLAEDGALRLDDPITRLVTEGPAEWSSITLHHLLTHTSGIPDYEDTLDFQREHTEDDLVRFAATLPLESRPGERWTYSSTGYALLGVIISRITGRFYGEFLRERIFRPAGMPSARVISEADIVPQRAAAYRLVDGELKNRAWVAPSLNTTADGSLHLSLLDMIVWDRVVRASAILRPESWAAMHRRVLLNNGTTHRYGLGIYIDEEPDGSVYKHGGSWQGYRPFYARYLADDLSLVVLANLASAEPEDTADGIRAIVRGRDPS